MKPKKRTRRPNGSEPLLAVSYRLGGEIRGKIKDLAKHYKTSDADMVRQLVEERHKAVVK